MERKRKNLSIFFVYTKILSTFAIAKHIVRYRTTGGERRPTSRVWAFFNASYFKRTHDPHYTISGGTPVDITSVDEVYMFRDRECCRFSCLHGGDAPCREDGRHRTDIKGKCESPTSPPFLPIESGGQKETIGNASEHVR